MLLECIDEVGGVVGGKTFVSKVFYRNSEGGEEGIMCPKESSILYRGLSMMFEVSYQASVGDDASFFEPIHFFCDLGVDVAAGVSNGEEGVLNDHIVGNVPEMDPHVLEVGHRVV